MQIKENIKIIDNVHIPITDAPAGILVSGGADSALLLYFLMKNTNKTIHIFSLGNQKKIKNLKTSIDVVSKCAELTDNYNFIHHINYEKEKSRENLFYLPTLFLKNKIISCVYTGITKNPPDFVTANFKNVSKEDDERNPNIIRDTQIREYFIPWTNLDKKSIAFIYTKYNLIDTLFQVTRSCEILDEKIDQNLTDEHCGKCWWCEERIWGFGRYK